MSMKKQLTEIDSKLKTLRLKLKQAEEIIAKRDREAVERHRVTILNLTKAVKDLRSSIEELKFSAGESEETVTTWSREIAQELSCADKSCAELSKCAKVIDDGFKAAEEAKQQETVIGFEKQFIQQKLEAELKQKELSLQPVTECDVRKIHKFYEQLLFNVESLRTLGKLEMIEGASFYIIIKKLEVLKAELVAHVSGDWRDWSFSELLEALRK
ncbi:Hypothetical predicted protein [Paramuricea clavata]|uniref:Uncharacterized protein n=1 Tax=Paramuricea clavata TaxID=317549 RepID=A0A6S7GGK9_PARCT|nr:Hypothetical predicted protein [Paramuricea clavata]